MIVYYISYSKSIGSQKKITKPNKNNIKNKENQINRHSKKTTD